MPLGKFDGEMSTESPTKNAAEVARHRMVAVKMYLLGSKM